MIYWCPKCAEYRFDEGVIEGIKGGIILPNAMACYKHPENANLVPIVNPEPKILAGLYNLIKTYIDKRTAR